MPIAILDFIAVLAAAAALTGLFSARGKSLLNRDTRGLLIGMVFFMLAYNACLFIEWAGISKNLDTLENYFGALLPMWWIIILYALLQDISGHDVRQSESKFRLIVENQFDLILKLDLDNHILFASPSYCNALGKTEEELLGEKHLPLVRPEVRPQVAQALAAVFLPPFSSSFEEPMETAGGDTRKIGWLAHSVQAEPGGVHYIIAVGRDITERKAAEEELKKHREHLEESVKERTAELQKENNERKQVEAELRKAKNAAEAANQAKSQFLSSMSHELRTPLNAILGFSRLMSRDPAIPPGQQKNLGIINRSGEHLLMLINDVLDMSKIEAGRVTLNLEYTNLYHTLVGIEEMIRSRAEEKGLYFTVEHFGEINRRVNIDGRKLSQILINLLGNAIKFTQRGGILLRVKVPDEAPPGKDEQEKFVLRFEVEDTGRGIPEQALEHIFEPFTQEHKDIDNNSGTGLGLAISKQFIQLMGGGMEVESGEGKGTLFKFFIRAEAVDSEPEESRRPLRRVVGLEPGQPDYRILIVEDNEANRTLMRQLLQFTGFQVNEAENGQKAVELFQAWDPHLVWMDIHMPVMDGYEATRQIRTLPGGKKVRIVALTASAFVSDQHKALDAGCDHYLRKPCREESIFETMARLLDVKYLYEAAPMETPADSPPLDGPFAVQTAIEALPPELREDIQKAALKLDVQEMAGFIEQVEPLDEALAKALGKAIEDLDFEQILRWFEPEDDKKSHES